MGVFLNHKNTNKYLTGNKIAEVYRLVAKLEHPDMVKEDLKKLSTHSAQVIALVLRLSKANCKPDFLKSRLRYGWANLINHIAETLLKLTNNTIKH